MVADVEGDDNKQIGAEAVRQAVLIVMKRLRPMDEDGVMLDMTVDDVTEALWKTAGDNCRLKKLVVNWTNPGDCVKDNKALFKHIYSATDAIRLAMNEQGLDRVAAESDAKSLAGGGAGGQLHLSNSVVETLASGSRRDENRRKEQEGTQVKETQLQKDLLVGSIQEHIDKVEIEMIANGDKAGYKLFMGTGKLWALQVMGMGIPEGQKCTRGKILEDLQDYADLAIKSLLDDGDFSRDEGLGYTVEIDLLKIRSMRADKRAGHMGEIFLVHFVHRLMGIHPASQTQRAPMQGSFADLETQVRRALALAQVKFPNHFTDEVIEDEIKQLHRFEKRCLRHFCRATQAYMDKCYCGRMVQWVQWFQRFVDDKKRITPFPPWAPFQGIEGSAMPAGVADEHIDGFQRQHAVFSALMKGDLTGGLGFEGISASGVTKFNYSVFWIPAPGGFKTSNPIARTGMVMTAASGSGGASPATPAPPSLADAEDDTGTETEQGETQSARKRARKKRNLNKQLGLSDAEKAKLAATHAQVATAAAAEARRKTAAKKSAAAAGGATRVYKLADAEFQAVNAHLRNTEKPGGGKMFPLLSVLDSKRACTFDLLSKVFPDQCAACKKGGTCGQQHWEEETLAGAGYGADAAALVGVKEAMPIAVAALESGRGPPL
jgi:hypothetical protein